MIKDNNKSADVKTIPPLIPLLFIATCWLVDKYVYSLPISIPSNIKLGFAYFFMIISAILFVSSLYFFLKTHQNPEPHTPTNSLYTKGIYRFTRNPIYLGFITAQIVVAIQLNNLYIILTLPLVIYFLTIWVIKPEETYLKELFKENYNEYIQKVRRWL